MLMARGVEEGSELFALAKGIISMSLALQWGVQLTELPNLSSQNY